MVRDFQMCIGVEAREQFLEMTGLLPDAVCACVGGGSNSMGMFTAFLGDPLDIYGVEPSAKAPGLGIIPPPSPMEAREYCTGLRASCFRTKTAIRDRSIP